MLSTTLQHFSHFSSSEASMQVLRDVKQKEERVIEKGSQLVQISYAELKVWDTESLGPLCYGQHAA